MRLIFLLTLAFVCFLTDAEANSNAISVNRVGSSTYYWESVPVGSSAQLVTLLCRACDRTNKDDPTDVPLVSVLRDTLGDEESENDRLTSVWLLSFERPTFVKRALSAVPFFYWRAGPQPSGARSHSTAPLLDLTSLQHPMVQSLARDIVQWTMLDSATMPIRASSRAYRSNEADHERLHLEEALSYLRAAPSYDGSSGLTETQLDLLIARLELRKKLLGGFVSEEDAAQIGKESAFKAERIRSRNWELLRQCAEKAGLYFEPLSVADIEGQYAMLWFPADEASEPNGTELGPVWKLLGIKSPWHDANISSAKTAAYMREVDANGNLLPFGAVGAKQTRLIPLSVYSLNYPKQPLLLVDFRDGAHLRHHEMLQRSIDEITAGVIGISHFTNWYYYVAADVYDFVASRHGAAMNQSARLDCYSQFRVKLALDHQLEPALRRDMQERVNSLAMNPLESAPKEEIEAARQRYMQLEADAKGNGRLLRSLDRNRRAELMAETETQKQLVRDSILHNVTLGMYTHRSKADAENLAKIDGYRRFQYQLNFLTQLVDSGTQPEVAYDSSRIQKSVRELSELLPGIASQNMREQAIAAVDKLKRLSLDTALQAECSATAYALRASTLPQQNGVALKPSVVHVPPLGLSLAGKADGD